MGTATRGVTARCFSFIVSLHSAHSIIDMLVVTLSLTLLVLSALPDVRAEEPKEALPPVSLELDLGEGLEKTEQLKERQAACPSGPSGKRCRRLQRQQGQVELEERQAACPSGPSGKRCRRLQRQQGQVELEKRQAACPPGM